MGERLRHPRPGLLWVPLSQEDVDEPEQADHARVEGVDQGGTPVPPGIVERQPLLEVRPALGEAAHVGQRRADDTVAGHPRRVVATLLGRLQQLPRGLVRRGQLAALEVDDEAAVEGREELRRVAQLAAQLARPGVGAAGLRRGEAPGGERRLAERDPQAELAPPALRRRRAGSPAPPAPRSGARPPRPSRSARAPAPPARCQWSTARSARPASAQCRASSSGSASAVSGKRSSSARAIAGVQLAAAPP